VRRDARLGYAAAALAAAVSGFAVFFNAYGVRLFADATLYTTLKNAVVGVLVLAPLAVLPAARRELRGLRRRQWAWLGALALVGGSVPYVLFFEGLRQTTPATGAVLNHLQFAVVALLAVPLLRERVTPAMWLGLAALLAGALLGTDVGALRWNGGAALVLVSTVLFGAGFVLARHLLRDLSTSTVIAAKMTAGSAVLIAWSAATGRLGTVAHLGGMQWRFVLASGLILLAFTVATLVAIRHAQVTSVTAIGMAAPAVTFVLQEAAGHAGRLAPADVGALALTVSAVLLVLAAGLRAETAVPPSRRPLPTT
jgi:drug/metabolite transporter (DMT)-like permease